MAAVVLPESLNREILAELRRMASQGAGLNDMVKNVQQRLGFAPDYIVPVFPYFCRAFSLPLVEVLPLREYSNRDNPELQGLLDMIRNAAVSEADGKSD
jgi:hypothetical protein